MMAAFELHPRLAADTFRVCELPLSSLLLMNDARFPWCILAPRRDGLRELHALPPADGAALLDEIRRVARALEARGGVDKMNVAALGNQVPQLHVHVIARRQDDPAWPNPVWGSGAAEPYDDASARGLVDDLRQALDAR